MTSWMKSNSSEFPRSHGSFLIPINASEAIGWAADAREPVRLERKDDALQLAQYTRPEGQAALTLDSLNETVWASQRQIAEFFGVSRKTATTNA